MVSNPENHDSSSTLNTLFMFSYDIYRIADDESLLKIINAQFDPLVTDL